MEFSFSTLFIAYFAVKIRPAIQEKGLAEKNNYPRGEWRGFFIFIFRRF
jgi:hypothetical protein